MRKNLMPGCSSWLSVALVSRLVQAHRLPRLSNPGDPNVIYTQAAETIQARMAMTDGKPTATLTADGCPYQYNDPVIAEGMTATANVVLHPPNATPTFNVQEAVTGQATPPLPLPLPWQPCLPLHLQPGCRQKPAAIRPSWLTRARKTAPKSKKRLLLIRL